MTFEQQAMADKFDKASEIEELFKREALSRRAPEGPPPKGACHNCDEPLASGQRWCDADCRHDWERRQALS